MTNAQPVVLTFLLDSLSGRRRRDAYTVLTALVVNALVDHPAQRVIGAAWMLAGVTVLLLTVRGAPIVLMALFALHMFKVIYGFAVDHYARRAG